MKKLFLTFTLVLIGLTLMAQTKPNQTPQQHLPPIIKLQFTDLQTVAILNKIDSLQQMLITSDLPSSKVQGIIQRTLKTFEPFYSQLRTQLVTDTLVKLSDVFKNVKSKPLKIK